MASKTRSDYDVIVVGSGAAGGTTAYALAMEGIKVLMLEAGETTTRSPKLQCSRPRTRHRCALQIRRSSLSFRGFLRGTKT